MHCRFVLCSLFFVLIRWFSVLSSSQDMSSNTIRQRMNRTGIGFAGIDGAWWLPAAEPFVLPRQVAGNLARLGAAIFALFDVVASMYGTPEGAACGLDQLLEYKVPVDIPRLMTPGRALAVRPDFQLCPSDGKQRYH